MTLLGVIFPFATICSSVSNEKPGLNGERSSRSLHGPIAFWVA